MGGVLEASLVMATGIKPKKEAENEANRVWEALKFSFECLARGRFPRVGLGGARFEPGTQDYERRGQWLAPIPGTDLGWTAVHILCKADLEWMCNDLGLHSYGSNMPCGLCAADRGETP